MTSVESSIAEEQLVRTREAGEHMRQAQLHLQARKYSEAIQEVDKALGLDPTNSNAYNLKGYAYLRSGNYEEAVKNLKRSIESDPANVWGHYNLALAYWAEKKPDQAVEEVKEVLKLTPVSVTHSRPKANLASSEPHPTTSS